MLKLAVPIVVPLSLNATDPVANDGVTVAVKVTVCPYVEGFGEDVSVTVVSVFAYA